jgi:uncharacterized protein (TIGR02646 family)
VRAITKGQEPPSLTAHRQSPHSDYDNFQDKNELRQSLLTEQRGICCYCMDRIDSAHDRMRIEHWKPQSRHRDEQLNYRNLLGACLGGEGLPRKLQHCDTRKGEDDIDWNPANPEHHIETRVRYEMDGMIRSDNLSYDAQLVEVLNLNLSVLKNNRAGILAAILEWWKSEKARIQGAVPRERFERERDKRVAGVRALQPYSPVVVWWLDKRLARM